eukprot:7391953-Prymnesium_polylepis.1
MASAAEYVTGIHPDAIASKTRGLNVAPPTSGQAQKLALLAVWEALCGPSSGLSTRAVFRAGAGVGVSVWCGTETVRWEEAMWWEEAEGKERRVCTVTWYENVSSRWIASCRVSEHDHVLENTWSALCGQDVIIRETRPIGMRGRDDMVAGLFGPTRGGLGTDMLDRLVYQSQAIPARVQPTTRAAGCGVHRNVEQGGVAGICGSVTRAHEERVDPVLEFEPISCIRVDVPAALVNIEFGWQAVNIHLWLRDGASVSHVGCGIQSITDGAGT